MFQYRQITEEGVEKCKRSEEAAFKFHDEVVKYISDSREKALFITKLQEAMFWLKKGISLQNEKRKTIKEES